MSEKRAHQTTGRVGHLQVNIEQIKGEAMSKIKIIPFGGVRENGKNMYAVEVDSQIFILDCGLKYPENELMGIDVVVPTRPR